MVIHYIIKVDPIQNQYHRNKNDNQIQALDYYGKY